MSSSDPRQNRYANTNANARLPNRNWGADPAREYRPVGHRYGSVLVLSGPKRKQTGPAVRKPIPRPVNLPSQRKDRQAEGSLLGGKQTRTDESAQSENTAQSLNSHTWHNPSGTWTASQDNSSRTDEYGFPIRSEAPINAREFPSLAASKQAPATKKTTQQDQADAYFSLDDRDILPAEDVDTNRPFGSRREDRAENRQDWRSGREGDRPFRSDDFEGGRAFPVGRTNPESRRGAFGFNNPDADRRGGPSGSSFGRNRPSDGVGAYGGRGTATGPRLEDYGLRPGSSPGDRPKAQDDYVGPASQVLGATNTIISSTLLGSGMAGPSPPGQEEEDDEEDEELTRHYMELEAIKQEEEEKDRQRQLAAEAPSADEAEEGVTEEGGSWEDVVDDQASAPESAAEECLGIKPIDHQKWQQRQAEMEAEDLRRRERAEAKKRELEEMISRREQEKQRAAREASEAAMAALTAASAPLPPTPPIVPPPPPPPPRTQAAPEAAANRVAAPDATHARGSEQLEAAARRPEIVPAPAPAQPAWSQSLYSRESSKPAAEVVLPHAPPPPPPPREESSHTSRLNQDTWQEEQQNVQQWRDSNQGQAAKDGPGRSRDGGRGVLALGPGRGRGRGRRGEGAPRTSDGRGSNSRASASMPGSDTTASREGAQAETGSMAASDADAAAVAAAAKVAKTMESMMLALPGVPATKAGKDAGKGMMNGAVEVEDGRAHSNGVTAHESAAMYSGYSSGAALMSASDAVHTLEHSEKRGGMFDGKEDGEDLLPSNIFGGDDAPYAGTSCAPGEGHQQLLPPLHNSAFGASLAGQSKSVPGMSHSSSTFSPPDHSNNMPSFGGAPQAPSMHDHMPDAVPLWGRSHEWAPPPAPMHHSADLHMHPPPPFDVSYMASSSSPQQAPTTAPAPPPFNAFGYPSTSYANTFNLSQPSYPMNPVYQPLVPTSKPPDWSNNGHSALGWASVAPPRSTAGMHSVMPTEPQAFSMHSRGSSFTRNNAPTPPGPLPVTHGHLDSVEMNLPENLGLGTSTPTSSVALTPQVPTPQPPPPTNLNSRSSRVSRSGRGSSSGGAPPPPSRGSRPEGGPQRRHSDADRSNHHSSGVAGSGGSNSSGGGRRQGYRGSRGRGSGRRGRDRADSGSNTNTGVLI